MDAVNKPIRTLLSDGKVKINKALLYERLGKQIDKQGYKARIAQGTALFGNVETKQSIKALRNPNLCFSTPEWEYDASMSNIKLKPGYYRICNEPGFAKMSLYNNDTIYQGYTLYNSGDHDAKSTLHQTDLGLLVNKFSISMYLATSKISPLIIESKKQDELTLYSKRPIFVASITMVENETGEQGVEVLWFRW